MKATREQLDRSADDVAQHASDYVEGVHVQAVVIDRNSLVEHRHDPHGRVHVALLGRGGTESQHVRQQVAARLEMDTMERTRSGGVYPLWIHKMSISDWDQDRRSAGTIAAGLWTEGVVMAGDQSLARQGDPAQGLMRLEPPMKAQQAAMAGKVLETMEWAMEGGDLDPYPATQKAVHLLLAQEGLTASRDPQDWLEQCAGLSSGARRSLANALAANRRDQPEREAFAQIGEHLERLAKAIRERGPQVVALGREVAVQAIRALTGKEPPIDETEQRAWLRERAHPEGTVGSINYRRLEADLDLMEGKGKDSSTPREEQLAGTARLLRKMIEIAPGGPYEAKDEPDCWTERHEVYAWHAQAANCDYNVVDEGLLKDEVRQLAKACARRADAVHDLTTAAGIRLLQEAVERLGVPIPAPEWSTGWRRPEAGKLPSGVGARSAARMNAANLAMRTAVLDGELERKGVGERTKEALRGLSTACAQRAEEGENIAAGHFRPRLYERADADAARQDGGQYFWIEGGEASFGIVSARADCLAECARRGDPMGRQIRRGTKKQGEDERAAALMQWTPAEGRGR